MTLFNRAQSRASLTTPAGERFLEEARKLMVAADRAVDLARRTARGEIGELSIGMLILGTGAFFPRAIRGFRELYPGIQLTLQEMMSLEQPEALMTGKIDIGFLRPLQPPYDRHLDSETL